MSFLLTIDDGPSEHAEAKLDFLNSHAIKAIWFCLGQNLEKRPEVAKALIRSGHILANHSFSHSRFSDISLDSAMEEIASTEKIIDDIYASVKVLRPAKLFRFPYGVQGDNASQKGKLETLLHQLGFVSVPAEVEFYDRHISNNDEYDWLWSYDIQEWAIEHQHGLRLSPDGVKNHLKHYLDTYDRNLKQIILIHDHERTTQYFPELIDLLRHNNEFEVPSF